MSTSSDPRAETGWTPVDTVLEQAVGVLIARNRCSAEEAATSLDEMAALTGLHLRIVAADVVGSTRSKDTDQALLARLSTEYEVDVEVLVDDVWWPGYLYLRDWHETTQGRRVCFVRFNTWESPEGRINDRARHFDEDHIRPAVASRPGRASDRR